VQPAADFCILIALMQRSSTCVVLGLGVFAAACGSTTGGTGGSSDTGISSAEDPRPESSTVDPGDGSTSGTTTGSGTTGATMPDESEEDGPIIFDVVGVPDSPGIMDGCNAVDFLFVIDDSGSMYSYQQNLVMNFPTFSDGIQSTLENVLSYQVGVVATDAYANNDPPCGALGDLVISTVHGGFGDSSNMVCGPYAEGHNYMTEADDLGMEFACAAQLGTYGDGIERPMEAMVNTLGPQNDGPGECNEGFIRDNALLVVVIITDEYDGAGDTEGVGSHSSGDPQSWYDAVVAAKLGIPENAVVMSLINYVDGPCVPMYAWEDGMHIKTFTEMFGENGFLGGICEPDYGPIFQQAIGVIETACDNFIPPG